jgi:hypothetical protein
MLAVLLLLPASTSVAAPSTDPASRVVVVLAPYVTWDDIVPSKMPFTTSLAEKGLLADANVRSSVTGGGADSLIRGALMFSAGTSVRADAPIPAFSADEKTDVGRGADVYARVYGATPEGAQVVYPGLPQQKALNASTLVNAQLGAVGQTVRDAGGVTIAVGNSDAGNAASAPKSRPAGVAATDGSGRVSKGDVSTRLLAPDLTAPFGVRANVDVLDSVYTSATAAAKAPTLAVLDPGDLARATTWATYATTSTAAAQRDAALLATDEVVKKAAASLGSNDLLVFLVPTVSDAQDGPASFAPLILYGRGLTGIATSPSTHREGIVTLMDVSTTVLTILGLKPPASMVGSPIAVSRASVPLADRVDQLVRTGATSLATESVRNDLVNWFILYTVIVLLLSVLFVYRASDGLPERLCQALEAALLFSLCVPLASLLQFVWYRWPPSGQAVELALLATALVLTAAAVLVGMRRPAAIPLVAVTSLTALVISVDQWLGAPLTLTGVFGYSPIFGARYYGLGNEMAGLLLGSVFVAFCLLVDLRPKEAWVPVAKRWGPLALGAIVIATSAAPGIGANFGTVAWMTVGFGVLWLLLNGKKVWTWRNALIAVLLVVVIVGGLAALDAVRSPGTETHLGRAVTGTEQGGFAAFWLIVVRKAEANMRVLGRTNWTWLLAAVLLLLGYMRWRPRGEFAGMLKEYPAFSAALGAALFAGVVGNFTEDSGVIVPALVMLPVGVTAVYLMLSRASCGKRSG